MKVKSCIYLSRGNLPSKVAHASQIVKMSQAFAQKIEDFELITSGDVQLFWKGLDKEFKEFYNIHHDFKLIRLPVHLKSRLPLSKGYYTRRFQLMATTYVRLKRPDLTYTRTPKLLSTLLKHKVPTLWEWHEPVSEASDFRGFFEDENLVGVVTISSELAENFVSQGLPPDKVLVAGSAVDLKSFYPPQTKADARVTASLPQEKKIILYAGHLYDSKGIPTIIRVAKKLPEYLFVFVGGWEEDIRRVRSICRDEELRNVLIAGHVEQSRLSSYLYSADILLLPTSKTWNLANTTSPLKLFEYMAASRPIVASALPNIMSVLKTNESAVLAEPDSPESFQKAIVAILENPKFAEYIANNAYLKVQSHTWDKRAENILDFASWRLQELYSHAKFEEQVIL